jgi:colicin import membrane protein
MTSATILHEFSPPHERAGSKSFAFSIAVHLLLIAALTWGVSWNKDNSLAFEAELWQSVPQLAAPKLVETPDAPTPEPEPTPEPIKKEELPKPIDNTQALREAQLATERLKKLEQERLEKDRLEKERLERVLKENERLKKEKAEKTRLEKERLEKERLEKEKLEKEKIEKEKKAKETANAQKPDKEAAHKKELEDKKLEALRQEQLKRMAGMAGASGAENSSGTALKSSGPSASYAGRIKGRVKPNIIYPEISTSENPVAEVSVRVSPDGTIISKRLTKPSGNAAWDAAVLKAIDKTERFPRDTDGSIPPEIILTFRPNE